MAKAPSRLYHYICAIEYHTTVTLPVLRRILTERVPPALPWQVGSSIYPVRISARTPSLKSVLHMKPDSAVLGLRFPGSEDPWGLWHLPYMDLSYIIPNMVAEGRNSVEISTLATMTDPAEVQVPDLPFPTGGWVACTRFCHRPSLGRAQPFTSPTNCHKYASPASLSLRVIVKLVSRSPPVLQSEPTFNSPR